MSTETTTPTEPTDAIATTEARHAPIVFTTNHARGQGLIHIDKVHIGPRWRTPTPKVLAYIQEELFPSIAQHGLIQPITLFHNKALDRFELIAGWSRLQAWRMMPETQREIPYNDFTFELSRAESTTKELEENFRRQEMDWKDKVRGILFVHQENVRQASSKFQNWTMEATGHVLGVKVCTVSYMLLVGKALEAGDKDVAACDTYTAAYKLIMSRFEAEAIKEAHARQQGRSGLAPTNPGFSPIAPAAKTTLLGQATLPGAPKPSANTTPGAVDILDLDLGLPEVAPLDTQLLERRKIPLSKMIILADCIEWMDAQPAASFDLIYSDPPFGIEMKNLEELGSIGLVKEAHDVDENLDLLSRFFKPAYRILKDKSHCMLWCDIVHWEKMTKWAEEAGFTVTNWPIIWCKPPGKAKNDASYKNPTKAIEYVMVLHKGQTVLRTPMPVNWFVADVTGERHLQTNPFLKPFSISRTIINASITPGMTMLDCFAGGGSLVRAAINLGIDVVGIEKNPEQFPLLVESIRTQCKEIAGDNIEFT